VTGARALPLGFAAVGSNGVDPPLFSLDVAVGDGRTTVSVAGELDLAYAEELSTAIRRGLADGPVLVDLRELAFMDSSGVRAINTALREASEAGRELRFVSEMQPGVVQVLEMTGMLGLLALEEQPLEESR
jgi:anti-sigma B factor antagonist